MDLIRFSPKQCRIIRRINCAGKALNITEEGKELILGALPHQAPVHALPYFHQLKAEAAKGGLITIVKV